MNYLNPPNPCYKGDVMDVTNTKYPNTLDRMHNNPELLSREYDGLLNEHIALVQLVRELQMHQGA